MWKAEVGDTGSFVAVKFGVGPIDAPLRNEIRHLTELVKQMPELHGVVRPIEAHFDIPQYPYVVYEFIDGKDLQKFLQERFRPRGEKSYSPGEAAGIIRQLAEIVAQFHSHSLPKERLVHRDLKPANILMSSEEAPYGFRITDFGVGTLAERHD